MDTPNAPNPTNPNAQEQFVDAVQGLTNQAQSRAAQNQAQGLADQNQAQGLAAQGPANNNAQVGQNVPIQSPQQLDPAQPVPTGPMVPAPQVFYQNWIGKNLNSQVNLKKMQNHIFSVLGIGWKHTTFPTRSKLHDFI